MKLLSETSSLPSELVSVTERTSSPPEVKLPEGSEGRPSFGRKPKDALFSKQVQKAEGRAFFKTSSLPEGREEASPLAASFGKRACIDLMLRDPLESRT